MDQETQLMQALARLLSNEVEAQKSYTPYGLAQKAAGTPSNTAYLYETGGLFGRCEGPSQLINAMVGPIGVEKVLQWVGTDTEREFVDALKAVQETGSEQSTACGDCTKIYLKACAQFYCFGRFCRQTDELQFDRIGLRSHQNVPVRTLFGAITDAQGNVLVGSGETIRDAFFLQTRAVGYALRLKNSTLLWSGNPANNSGTAYQEYVGLQLMVNTGKFDAYTMLDCDSIDSFLMNFGYNNPQSAGTYAIQNWFRRMVLQFMRRAEGAGMDWSTAQMYVVMTPNMWDAVARAYACAGLDLCSGVSTSRLMSQDPDQARTRFEEYQERMALPIYGRWYPVILDSQIPETTGQANGICSDIYFLTTSINGEEVLYGQYQDFNATYGNVRQEMAALFGSDDIAITDNGRYALIRDNERGCFDVQAYTKPRVVSVTPWLLGRIQSVCADVLQEPLPDVTASGRVYERDGGRTIVNPPVLYGDCPDTLGGAGAGDGVQR
jgi:hypothetical protein